MNKPWIFAKCWALIAIAVLVASAASAQVWIDDPAEDDTETLIEREDRENLQYEPIWLQWRMRVFDVSLGFTTSDFDLDNPIRAAADPGSFVETDIMRFKLGISYQMDSPFIARGALEWTYNVNRFNRTQESFVDVEDSNSFNMFLGLSYELPFWPIRRGAITFGAMIDADLGLFFERLEEEEREFDATFGAGGSLFFDYRDRSGLFRASAGASVQSIPNRELHLFGSSGGIVGDVVPTSPVYHLDIERADYLSYHAALELFWLSYRVKLSAEMGRETGGSFTFGYVW